MSDLIHIDTEQVLGIANTMSGLNDDLKQTLESAKNAITNLESIWQGEAANATMDAIRAFATEYFQSYHDLINEYVEFLRKNVAGGYENTETTNTSLADSFR